ncbi:hypothetical protein Tco_0061923, partial [Tanacetum coccineum]
FEISSWRSATVDVRTYLLGGAIDSSKANGIIRDPKLELESSRFTFDLVPLRLRWSCKVRVGSNGNLLWEASVLLGRKKVDDRGVTEGREGVHEVFQQRGSGAKRKLSRCGRNQMGNDARSKDLEACLEKGRR